MENTNNKESVGILDYLTNLFFSPKDLAGNIVQKPRILVPLLISMVLVAVTTYLIKDLAFNFTLKQAMESMQASGADVPKEAFEAQLKMSMSVAIIAAPLSMLIMSLITSGILLLLVKIFKGEGSFSEMFSINSFVLVISSVGGLIQGLGKLLTNNYLFEFSPALFFGQEVSKAWFYPILSNINPFVIWGFIVSGILIKNVCNVSTKKTVAIVIIPLVITILISSLMIVMSTSLTGVQ